MEGQAATAAVTRINTATSKKAFIDALDDYRKIVESARERAIRRAPGQAAPEPQAQAAPEQAAQGGFDTDFDQLPENTPAEGEDGNIYMKRNSKLWRQTQSGWEEVRQ
jgi:hypothetical protein